MRLVSKYNTRIVQETVRMLFDTEYHQIEIQFDRRYMSHEKHFLLALGITMVSIIDSYIWLKCWKWVRIIKLKSI